MFKGIKFLLVFSLIGFLMGILITLGIKQENIEFIFNDSQNKVKIFINTFTINYWYIFLFWLFSLNEMSVFVSYGILFLKCSTLGVLFSLLIKKEALYGFWIFVIKLLGQMIFILLIMYFVLLSKINEKKKIIISTILLLIYSILNALI